MASRWILVHALVLAGCAREAPGSQDTAALSEADDAAVNTDGGTASPTKMDILFVIDQGASMCGVQRGITEGFKGFAAALMANSALDVQIAVTTVQQTPGKNTGKVVGRFINTPATAFGTHCVERVRMPCTADVHCKGGFSFTYPETSCGSMCSKFPVKVPPAPGGKYIGWTCKFPPVTSHIGNLDCSASSVCESRCDITKNGADCVAVFGKGASCIKLGGGLSNVPAACIVQPATTKCPPPSELPPVLTAANLDLFACIATVGASHAVEAKFEGGLRAAWMALDPKGPNCDYTACVNHLRRCCAKGGAACAKDQHAAKCTSDIKEYCEPLKGDGSACQHKMLLRDDAGLLVVFVSDDDDCSMHLDLDPLDKSVITLEVWEDCQVHGDSLGSNVPLNEANCEFKRVKSQRAYMNCGKLGTKNKQTTCKAKVANVWCPSDCGPGSLARTHADAPKCAGGCKEGSPEQKLCLAMAAEDVAKKARANAAIAPVSVFAALLQTLKPKPEAVHVAAIVGDTRAQDAAQANCHRVQYYVSHLKDQGPGGAKYICAGPHGTANYGHRYLELVKAFGKRGFARNVCDPQGVTSAMVALANKIAGWLGK